MQSCERDEKRLYLHGAISTYSTRYLVRREDERTQDFRSTTSLQESTMPGIGLLRRSIWSANVTDPDKRKTVYSKL